jgi:hypothetical protein
VSELVDAEGERVIGAGTRCDYPSPVVVELSMESAKVVSPPPFGPLESLQDIPVSLQGNYPGRNLVSSVFGLFGLLPVNREALLQMAAFLAAASAQPGESALAVELAGAVGGDGVPVGQPSFRRAKLLNRRVEGLVGVAGATGEHPLVFGYLVGQLPVKGPGVASGGQGWIGLTG